MELQNPVQRGLSISSRLQAVPLWHQWPQTVEMLAGHREHAFWPRQGAQASRLQRHALTDVAHERAHTHIPPCHVSDSWANSRVCRVSRRKRLAYSLRLVSYYRVTVLISQQHHQFDNALCCYQIYFQIKHQHQHDQICQQLQSCECFCWQQDDVAALVFRSFPVVLLATGRHVVLAPLGQTCGGPSCRRTGSWWSDSWKALVYWLKKMWCHNGVKNDW